MRYIRARLTCRVGPAPILVAALAVLLASVLCGEASGATAPPQWWMSNFESLGFDPFSLTTNRALLAAYEAEMGPLFLSQARTSKPAPKPKDSQKTLKPTTIVVEQSSGPTATPPALPGMPLPASSVPDTGTSSEASSGSSMLIAPARTLLVAPSQTLVICCRPPLRTPTLPEWP